jgi:uncharacterized protein
VRLHHFRDRDGAEIDALLVGQGEQPVGIKVRGSVTAVVFDARPLASFRNRVGNRFVHGFVIYLGDQVVSLETPHGRSAVVALGDLTAPSTDRFSLAGKSSRVKFPRQRTATSLWPTLSMAG